MKNILTIDVEDWYQTLDLNIPVNNWDTCDDRVHYGLNIILDLLDKYNIKATFFILGFIAKKHPELVKKIDNSGHEIGSHGTWHKLVYKQTKDEFREDIMLSKKILEDIIGKEVVLFRASSWSISENTLWALEILEEEGFICDSSIQPFKTPLSGISNAPTKPFYPVIGDKKLGILEFPPSVLQIGKIRVPFSGGLYLRTMPYSFIKRAIEFLNKSREAIIYIHPWEFDENQPRLEVPAHIKFTHYYNIKNNTLKLKKLLQDFDFITLGELIKNTKYEPLKIKG